MTHSPPEVMRASLGLGMLKSPPASTWHGPSGKSPQETPPKKSARPIRKATHALWAVQCLSNILALHHQSPRKNPTATESVVMAYIDDIVIATETIEDHLVSIKKVFECLREAGLKMRSKKCDSTRTETKYLRRRY